MKLPPPIYIDSARALQHWTKQLLQQKCIAVDTESNSLHAYRGKTCLIQLSTPAADLLVDPLMIDDISALAAVFADPKLEKVFHAAEYDLICLKRDFDFDVAAIFDTMAAARVCGYRRIGLGAMLEQCLGITHSKTHQTDDWAQRPLPAAYQQYAQMDTHYLLRLRDVLYAELRDAGRLQEAREYFADVTAFEVKPQEFDPAGFWDLPRPGLLDSRQMAALRELYILRDALARINDRPVGKLLGNKALLEIARQLPRRRSRLYGISGVPAWLVRRHGDELIEAVAHGCISRLPPSPPRPKPPPPAVAECYAALHTWRKQTALQRGVESDVIISRQALWEVARRQPQTVADLDSLRGIGPWRRQKYGAALVAVVRESCGGQS